MISIRYEPSRPSFHPWKISAISAGEWPPACRSRSYASAMSCMSAYSMPLCTIFTKWPAPSGPTCTQHGSPSTLAEMSSSSGPSDSYDSGEPPGMMLGPCSAPSSPPDTPVPTKCRPRSLQRRLAPPGVREVRVAGVDQHVARLEQRRELVDHRVGRLAGLHHDHHPARPFQAGHEVLGALRREERPLVRRTPRPAPWCGCSVRLCSATVWPWRAKLRARLRPITASPVTPICAFSVMCTSFPQLSPGHSYVFTTR